MLQEPTSDAQRVQARILLRTTGIRPHAPVNQLMYSDEIVHIQYRDIESGCDIRIFGGHESIPVPYSNGGIGNCFYITERWTGEESRALETVPDDIVQGLNFGPSSINELSGLDLFYGSGCFGHSVEEGASVSTLR